MQDKRSSTPKPDALAPIENEGGQIVDLPPITVGGAVPATWQKDATVDDICAACAYLLDMVEPECTEARQSAVTRALLTRDYSRAELLLAMREVPFQNDYGKGLRLDVIERIIRQHREDRAGLQRSLTRAKVVDLLERHPKALQFDDFHICGYVEGNRDAPLYRYAPDIGKPKEPVANLEEGPSQRREDGGTVEAGKLATDYLEEWRQKKDEAS